MSLNLNSLRSRIILDSKNCFGHMLIQVSNLNFTETSLVQIAVVLLPMAEIIPGGCQVPKIQNIFNVQNLKTW